jgi:hypothetical protein
MPGRRKDHDRFRLASGRQLWTLNSFGRLRLVDDGSPISSNEAKVLIAAEFERRGDPAEGRANRRCGLYAAAASRPATAARGRITALP